MPNALVPAAAPGLPIDRHAMLAGAATPSPKFTGPGYYVFRWSSETPTVVAEIKDSGYDVFPWSIRAIAPGEKCSGATMWLGADDVEMCIVERFAS